MKNIIKFLVATMLVAIMAVSVSAAVTTFELVPYDEAANQWEITVHINLELDDSVANSHINTFATQFFFNPEKLVLCDLNYEPITDYYAAGTTPIYCYPVKQGRIEYSYEAKPINDEGVSQMWLPQADGTVRGYVIVNSADEKFDSNDNLMFSIAFMLADGVSVEDLAYNDFVIHQLFAEDTYLGTYGYNYEAATDKQMTCTNTVVPEAPVVEAIKIPVTAGDKIYLQGSTTAVVAEATGEYEVPATVGYVAVNGADSQKTYYVDGTSATEVHTNGIVSTDDNSLRGPDETYNGEDRSGIRFLMNHNPEGREAAGHEIFEIGVIMTVDSTVVKNAIGEDALNDLKADEASKAFYGNYVRYGYALGDGYDRVFNSDLDDKWIISAVMYGINLTEGNVQSDVICRPYYKVGDTIIYGETMRASLYDVAKEIKNDPDSYAGLSPDKKAYVDKIIELVDGVETPIVNDEIIIDISGLYGV